jgi:hypothetical protein
MIGVDITCWVITNERLRVGAGEKDIVVVWCQESELFGILALARLELEPSNMKF